MAEQVNQRIEGMINELEQMKRTNLYDDDEIRELSRKRKEFEYKIQRRIKEKDDYVQYIAFELALLEDVVLRRKQAKVTEKKKDIEYAIAKRLNKVFKQFLFRYQNDVTIYFEYIKFCKSVGFEHAVTAIIGEMLRIHGDKPKAWQMGSLWESKGKKNFEKARSLLLKGIQRHPESEILYLDLFEIELTIALQAENEEDKEKYLKRAEVVWKNGMKNIPDVKYLFNIYNLSIKFGVHETFSSLIKEEIWNRRTDEDVWSYIANKELESFHWSEIEEFVNEESNYPSELNNYIAVYEEALEKFSDKTLCTKYIHGLLGTKDSVCTELQKISAVKHAWYYGHENGLLTNEMYAFGISMLKLEDEITTDDLEELIDSALAKNVQYRMLWEEKLLLNKSDEKKMLAILQEASKSLKSDDMLALWNFMFDNIDSNVIFKSCYEKFKTCENAIVLSLKPKLLQKIYEHNGIKAARQIYEEFIRTPPTQVNVHKVMIDLELSQEKLALKNIRKCYEALTQHHGTNNVEVWMDYMNFEQNKGSAAAVPAIHRRAIGMLEKQLVDEFIKAQALAKLK